MTRYASRHPSRGHSLKAQAAAQRERWMREFQRALVALVPAAAGRIDWQTAEYLFSVGRQAREAAAAMAPEAEVFAAKCERNAEAAFLSLLKEQGL